MGQTTSGLGTRSKLGEFVVGGFTAPKGSRKHLGAVVIGAYTKGKLTHYGYAGSGFSEKGLKDAVDRMKPLLIDKCPFVNPPNIKEKIEWVRPKLVCEEEGTGLGTGQLFEMNIESVSDTVTRCLVFSTDY